MRRVLLILIVPILFSCGPATRIFISERYEPTSYDRDIIVYEVTDPVPESAVKIGEIYIGDTGFSTDCSYNTVRQKLLIEARKRGAHAVQIYEHILPSFWSTCHSLKAYVFRFDDDENKTELPTEN